MTATLIYFSMTPPLLLLGFFTTMKGSIPPFSASACRSGVRAHMKYCKI
jgi:hypothetical protein